MSEFNPDSDDIDPAVLLMARLRQDPRMDGVPMYVTFPDGSTLSMQIQAETGVSTP